MRAGQPGSKSLGTFLSCALSPCGQCPRFSSHRVHLFPCPAPASLSSSGPMAPSQSLLSFAIRFAHPPSSLYCRVFSWRLFTPVWNHNSLLNAGFEFQT